MAAVPKMLTNVICYNQILSLSANEKYHWAVQKKIWDKMYLILTFLKWKGGWYPLVYSEKSKLQGSHIFQLVHV